MNHLKALPILGLALLLATATSPDSARRVWAVSAAVFAAVALAITVGSSARNQVDTSYSVSGTEMRPSSILVCKRRCSGRDSAVAGDAQMGLSATRQRSKLEVITTETNRLQVMLQSDQDKKFSPEQIQAAVQEAADYSGDSRLAASTVTPASRLSSTRVGEIAVGDPPAGTKLVTSA